MQQNWVIELISGEKPLQSKQNLAAVVSASHEDRLAVCGCVVKAMTEMNRKLEEERQMLLMQLQTLMNQLQELLTELINSKDSYANEQKTYLSVHLPALLLLLLILLLFRVGQKRKPAYFCNKLSTVN